MFKSTYAKLKERLEARAQADAAACLWCGKSGRRSCPNVFRGASERELRQA